MTALGPDAPATTIPARMSIAEAAPLFRDGLQSVGVTDATGQITGHLHRQAVIDLMLAG